METLEKTQVIDFGVEEVMSEDAAGRCYCEVIIHPTEAHVEYETRRVYHDELDKFIQRTDWFNIIIPSEYSDTLTAFLYDVQYDLDELIMDYLNIERI